MTGVEAMARPAGEDSPQSSMDAMDASPLQIAGDNGTGAAYRAKIGTGTLRPARWQLTSAGHRVML
jgi:hypothetical protein